MQTGVEIFYGMTDFENGTEDEMERLDMSDASLPA